MRVRADICLIIEGGYPYVLGGVSHWTDALIQSLPEWRFHIVAIALSSQRRILKYRLPENVVGLTEVLLDKHPQGSFFLTQNGSCSREALAALREVVTNAPGASFGDLVRVLWKCRLGARHLLDSRTAWKKMEEAYRDGMANAPLIDFFWAWRFLCQSVLSVCTAEIPEARLFHSLSTGYAGLYGARASMLRQRPLILTEHGIYTNERRIDISVADWIFESRGYGFGIRGRGAEMRDLWSNAFQGFSRIVYQQADFIVSQHSPNQKLQILDGAAHDKSIIIPNGIATDRFRNIKRDTSPRRPCVLLIGRVVPIKDIRTFIMAVSLLREHIPDVEALVMGPEEEDPNYAAGCRQLVENLELEGTIKFLGLIKDVSSYFDKIDVIALTSLSEGQPLVLLEAGAAGIPAVVTDVGCCREIIEGGPTEVEPKHGGIVVPACDPHTTAAALARILGDPDLRRSMGDALRERVILNYDDKKSTASHVRLYNSALQLDKRNEEASAVMSWLA